MYRNGGVPCRTLHDRRLRTASRRTSRGMSFLENVIALVIVSIGLLGIAGLQARSLEFNTSAHLQSTATSLAYDLTDRMRANREAAEDGDYDVELGDGAEPPKGKERATRDLRSWWFAVDESLPAASATVTVDSEGGARVRVAWANNIDPGPGSDSDDDQENRSAEERDQIELETEL